MTYLNSFFMMAPPQGDGGGAMINLVFLGAIFFVFYFFIIRPQTKRQKEIQTKVSEMKKGDKVLTSGGMMGIVSSIDDDSVLLEIDNGVKARFQKSAITDVNPNKK
ncbi:MAG TPA: preprotein translocase subunit YajC [Balneolaceae bacterium]|nr:preprotein translocase subunit YajC [Balneolaceae bacterium]